MPGVAKRRVAVTEMNGVGRGGDPVGKRTRARDHEVMLGDRKPLRGPRKQRKCSAKIMLPELQSIEIRGGHGSSGEPAFGSELVVEQGVDASVRPAVRNRGKRPLSTAHDE